MKRFMKLCLSGALLLATQASLAVNNNKDVLDFFNLYLEMNQRYDPTLAKYYSDDAWVVVTKYGDDTEMIEKIRGRKVKTIIADGMKYAKASFDSDKYSNIRVKDLGSSQYLIQADRYSIQKCYLDKEFSLTVKRADKNNFLITNQTTSNISGSTCKTSLQEDLPAKLQAIASMQNRNLPQQIFRGLTLEKVYADGLILNYQARMDYVNKDQVDLLKMRMELEPMFTHNACDNPEIKQELEKGMIVKQTLMSKDNQQVLSVEINKTSCQNRF